MALLSSTWSSAVDDDDRLLVGAHVNDDDRGNDSGSKWNPLAAQNLVHDVLESGGSNSVSNPHYVSLVAN